MDNLRIRELHESDCEIISQAFAAQGWEKPAAQYRGYLAECAVGSRSVLIAELAGTFAGYISVWWDPDYAPFRAQGIPEIADFNVLKRYQRQGIGTQLMDSAEKQIAARSPIAGIGVGLTVDYGPAYILYVRRGYIPDGQGLIWRGKPVAYSDTVTIDDELVLYFTKRVR